MVYAEISNDEFMRNLLLNVTNFLIDQQLAKLWPRAMARPVLTHGQRFAPTRVGLHHSIWRNFKTRRLINYCITFA